MSGSPRESKLKLHDPHWTLGRSENDGDENGHVEWHRNNAVASALGNKTLGSPSGLGVVLVPSPEVPSHHSAEGLSELLS